MVGLLVIPMGMGILCFSDGSKYDGEFINDVKDGNGIFIDKNGEKYEGEYKDGRMEGNGKITYKDNSVFDLPQ